MGVILWIQWRLYNFIANTRTWVLFLPPSDAYVRSFLYLLYTLIKLYYTHTHKTILSSLYSVPLHVNFRTLSVSIKTLMNFNRNCINCTDQFGVKSVFIYVKSFYLLENHGKVLTITIHTHTHVHT